MKQRFLPSRLVAIPIAICAALLVLTLAAGHRLSITSQEIEANLLRAQVPGVDLDVTYISRAPLYHAYCVEYPWDVLNQPGIPYLCFGTEGDKRWPDPGEPVTFTAHIINKGARASQAFEFAWMIDGVQVATGALPPLAPSAEITTTYQWSWGHGLSAGGQHALGEHTVGFIVDPANAIDETYESNNLLQDHTQAMSFNITLTPEMYAAYNQPIDPKFPYSAEDWLQKQIAAMNASFANAIYPATPLGSALRVRINQIGVAPTPPDPDSAHDGAWFINTDVRCADCGYYDPSVDIDWGLVHELSHQVSLIDLYAIGVYASNVFVEDHNAQLANIGFGWENGGLMGGGEISPYTDHNRYSSHTAGGSNTLAGYRNGYYGSYLFDIPQDNYLKILDNQGNPASQVQVEVYQRTGPWDWTGQMGVDDIPEISGITDHAGIFHLPNRSAQGGTTTLNGHVMRDNPFGVVDIIGNQGLLLVHLSRGTHQEFHWLDITQFNLAYWKGDVISHTYTITSHVPPSEAPAAPEISTDRVEGARTILEWQPSISEHVTGYRVYRATPPRYQYEMVSALLTETTFEEEYWGYDGGHRIYAVTALAENGKESGFGKLIYAPTLTGPTAVEPLDSGERLVLNQGDLYPLLKQQAVGRFSERLINVHYDLWNTHFMEFDPLGRMILSGFGEFPNERLALRLYDDQLRPLWAFGTEGSAPGQFVEPSGVAWWGQACPFAARPYPVDEHTLLLAHFDGDTIGAQGEAGTAIGASFEQGHFDQGILLDENDSLSFLAADNLTDTHGTVEFWLQPTWDGDAGGNYTLFWWGDGENHFHMRKDGISNLVFDYFYSGGSCGVPHNVASWQAGEWHHLGFTWDENRISLFIDGQQVMKETCAGIAKPAASHFYVGSEPEGLNSVQAVIDELRISDRFQIGIEGSCGRILVADRGVHRLQAFDVLGNLIATFGSYGSSEGQFDTPQGIVVDGTGRVFVADQGNDRLVVLGFDGLNFSILGSYSAAFNAPTGLAIDSYDNLYVADTGNKRVVFFDPDGNLLGEFTEPNDAYSGDFKAPQGVAIAPNGDIIVADTGNRRVVTVQRPGWVIKIFSPQIFR